MEQERKKIKKKTQANDIPAVYLSVGAAIVCLLTFFGISAFLRVNNIIVDGIYLYSAEQVAEVSGISKGDNLFYISSRNVERKIIEELPYISSAKIDRDFPDTLNINVVESKAVAYIPFAGDALVIDSSGRVLDILPLIPGSPIEIGGHRVLEIRGITINEASVSKMPSIGQGNETNFNAMKELLAAFEREIIERRVNYLDIGNITNISFGYMDKYRVTVGGQRNLNQKISSLQSIVIQVQETYPISNGTIDMTDPSGQYKFVPDNY